MGRRSCAHLVFSEDTPSVYLSELFVLLSFPD